MVKYFFSDATMLQSLIWSHVPGSPVDGTQNYRNLSVTYDFIFSRTMLNQVEFGFHSWDCRLRNAPAANIVNVNTSANLMTRVYPDLTTDTSATWRLFVQNGHTPNILY